MMICTTTAAIEHICKVWWKSAYQYQSSGTDTLSNTNTKKKKKKKKKISRGFTLSKKNSDAEIRPATENSS